MAKSKINIDYKLFGGVAVGAIGSAIVKKQIIKMDFFKIVGKTDGTSKMIDYAQNLIPTIGLGIGFYYYGVKKNISMLEGVGLGAISTGIVTGGQLLGIGSTQSILTGIDNQPYMLDEAVEGYMNGANDYENQFSVSTGMNGTQQIQL
jgi:hypothetical protein